jgi:hypothetical protein
MSHLYDQCRYSHPDNGGNKFVWNVIKNLSNHRSYIPWDKSSSLSPTQIHRSSSNWPDSPSTCNYPDSSVPRACLRLYKRYSGTNGISSNDFSKARKRNKPWPATTHLYVHSTIQYVSVDRVDRLCMRGLFVCYRVSIPFIWNRLMNLFERKDTKQTVLHKRWTSYCKHYVSEHLQRRSPNYLLSMVVSVFHLLPYMCGKT